MTNEGSSNQETPRFHYIIEQLLRGHDLEHRGEDARLAVVAVEEDHYVLVGILCQLQILRRNLGVAEATSLCAKGLLSNSNANHQCLAEGRVSEPSHHRGYRRFSKIGFRHSKVQRPFRQIRWRGTDSDPNVDTTRGQRGTGDAAFHFVARRAVAMLPIGVAQKVISGATRPVSARALPDNAEEAQRGKPRERDEKYQVRLDPNRVKQERDAANPAKPGSHRKSEQGSE